MHFVDDIDLVAGGDRSISNTLNQLSHIVDAGPAGGIHLNDVDMTVLANGDAAVADTAGIDCRPAVAVRSNTIQRTRDNTRRRRLSNTANTCQHERVRNAPGFDRVRKGADKRVLSNQLIEILGPVLPGENAIFGGFGGLCHTRSPIAGDLAVKKVEDWTNNPGQKLVTAASFRT